MFFLFQGSGFGPSLPETNISDANMQSNPQNATNILPYDEGLVKSGGVQDGTRVEFIQPYTTLLETNITYITNIAIEKSNGRKIHVLLGQEMPVFAGVRVYSGEDLLKLMNVRFHGDVGSQRWCGIK